MGGLYVHHRTSSDEPLPPGRRTQRTVRRLPIRPLGTYRVVYQIDEERRTIYILAVRLRGDVCGTRQRQAARA
ncbi:MAG: type II toxin-antitoxin system RelE/ParE family toxin [Actinobacteria bacterium]|nr:type II toxin-antitoxin system RelE/ParE family toxin [Actinomycetota bacterium]